MYPSGGIPFWDPMMGECVAACPEERSPAEGEKICRTCAEVHGQQAAFWNDTMRQCVTKCEETSSYGLCVLCDSYFAYDTPVWNEGSQACVPCPDNTFWDPNIRECAKGCNTNPT